MTKQTIKFRGETLTHKEGVVNILKVWEMCSEAEKYDWYADAHNYAITVAHKWVGSLHVERKHVMMVCGVIAALSPLKTWEHNKKLASDLILKNKTEGHFRSLISKAKLILHFSKGDHKTILTILNGMKIKSFYKNIAFPEKVSSVTIDRHAISVAIGKKLKNKETQISEDQYRFFETCYKEAAAIEDVSPLRMQSAVWLKWRNVGLSNITMA